MDVAWKGKPTILSQAKCINMRSTAILTSGDYRLHPAHHDSPRQKLQATRQLFWLSCVVVAFLAAPVASLAEVRTWSPQTGSNIWNAASNWTPAGVPQFHDDVIVDLAIPAASLASGDSVALNSLSLTSGGRLFTAGHKLTVDNASEDATARAVGSGSTLVVDAGASTGVDARVDILEILTGAEARLNGGVLEVDSHLLIDASSRITGNGTVRLTDANLADSPSLTIQGVLRPNGGRGLYVSAPEGTDVIFGSETTFAQLDAGFGDLTIDVTLDDRIKAVATVGSGRTISFEQGVEFDTTSVINLQGGAETQATLLSEKTVVWGRVNADRLAGMSGEQLLRETAEIHLPDAADRLVLRGDTIVIGEDLSPGTPGAQFVGDGVVVNDESSHLTLLSAPVVDVEVINAGIVDLGYIAFTSLIDVGRATFGEFRQTETGELHYDIGQTGGQLVSDRYRAATTIALDGLLHVELVELPQGETPILSVGDSFAIASAPGGITGKFSHTILPDPPTGATWELTYFEEAVTLSLVATTSLAGDYNNDGLVDLADYTVWRDLLGSPAGNLLNDIDGGIVGAAQYATWKANFNAVATSMAQANTGSTVPEPPGACLALAAILGTLLQKFRTQRVHQAVGTARARS